MSQDSQGLLEKLKELAEKIAKNKHLVKNEAHTRAEFVKPFLKILGYDGIEVLVPEYDAGIKDGRKKVDYAILCKNQPLVAIEIKHCNTELNESHIGQLDEYYYACVKKGGGKFGILTNGLEYQFFADSQNKNTMDSTPFMVLNLESKPLESTLTSEKLAILELFKQAKLSSNLATIRKRAESILKQNADNALCADIKEFLAKEINKPSDEFVGFVLDKKFKGRNTAQKIKEFRAHIIRACSELISDKVDEKIAQKEAQNAESQGDSKELSEDEIGAFYIVRGILMENPKATLQNIVPRGTAKAKYFSALLEDNKNKWICRIYLKHINDKYLAVPDKRDSTKELRFEINNLSDIYKYKNELLESLKMRLK